MILSCNCLPKGWLCNDLNNLFNLCNYAPFHFVFRLLPNVNTKCCPLAGFYMHPFPK